MESRNDRVARMFDAALEHPRTWIVLVFVGVAAAIVAGLTTHLARPSQSAWAYGIYMGLLALTLLAILWYSFETRKLVRMQREASELESHPWLHVAGWPIPRQHDPLEEIVLPIQNVGRTPAQITKISVAYDDGPQNLNDALVNLGGDTNPTVLAPGQQFLATIMTILVARQSTVLHLSVTIDYRALQGGGGQVVVRLRYAEGGWKSRRTEYAVTLASSRVLPAPAIDRVDAEVVSYQ